MIKKEPSKDNITNTRFFQQNISLMAAGIPDLLSAHHVLLRYAINIPKRAHQEVQNYKQPVSFVCHTRFYDNFLRLFFFWMALIWIVTHLSDCGNEGDLAKWIQNAVNTSNILIY